MHLWNFLIKVLWNAVEKIEKKFKCVTGERIIVALPVELSLSPKIKNFYDFCMEQFVDKGMCGYRHFTGRGIHMHILLDKTF